MSPLAAVAVIAMLAALAALMMVLRRASSLRLAAARTVPEELLRLLVDRTPAPVAIFDNAMCYLATNRHYLQAYGLDKAAGPETLIGRSHYEVFQDIPEVWRDIHRRVLAGEACSAQDDAFSRADGTTDRVAWEMLPWNRPDGTVGGAVLFSHVVSVRQQAERREALLLELADRQRAAPHEATAAAARLFGPHLGISRIAIGEVDEAGQQVTIDEGYNDGTVVPAAGTHSLTAFGSAVIEDLRAGRTVVVTDVLADPRTRDRPATYLEMGRRAMVAVPTVTGGKLRAMLCASHRDLRAWKADEVTLLEEVAARTWSAVEQTRVKRALERTVEEFRILADGIPTLCWMAEPDGHIYWYNRRWYEYTGTTPREMEGWGWQSVHDPAALPAVLERWLASLATGEPFEMTFPLRGADGVFRPFMTRVAPVRDPGGKVSRWLGINTDVTEAAKREADLLRTANALRESEARLQVVFDTVPVGIVISEAPSGRLVAGNRQADAIFRQPMVYTPEGGHYRDLVSFHRDGRRVERHETPMQRALAGEPHPESEVLYHYADGTQGWVRLIGAPLRTGERITGAVVAALDIDRQMRTLEALSAARNELEQRVAEAVQANRAKSRFLAGISHELRTPLNGILGYAQLLGMDGGLSDTQSARVQAMLGAGRHLLEMITCVLDLSEIEADHVTLQAVEVDPHAIAAACIDLVRPAAEAKGLALSADATVATPKKLVTDPTRLRQVLLNLLGNAVKFTRQGAVSVRLAMAADGRRLRIEVADTGPGIAAEHRQRLFQAFERLDSEATARIEGAGLGLALSTRLATLMGGCLGHDDNPNGGSVFWLELPIDVAADACPDAPCAAGSASAQPAPPTRTLHVLVVDDVLMNRDIASSFLRAAGHQVTCVEGGAEAVGAVQATDFDVVLMDVRMPDVDGLEATRRIRALAGAPGRVPIIALTAQAFTDQIAECRKAGMDSHLVKPFDLDTLLAAIGLAVSARPKPDAAPRPVPSSPGRAADPVIAAEPEVFAPEVFAPEVFAPEVFAPEVFAPEVFKRTAVHLTPEAVAAHLRTIATLGETLLQRLCASDALASSNPMLAEMAHELAGSAAMFGFERLASASRRFEPAIEAGAADAAALAGGLRAAIEVTEEAIRTRTLPQVEARFHEKAELPHVP